MDPLTLAILLGLGGGAVYLTTRRSGGSAAKPVAKPNIRLTRAGGLTAGIGTLPGRNRSSGDLRSLLGEDYDKLPPDVRSRLDDEFDAAKRKALRKCIDATGDAENCALLLDAIGDPSKLEDIGSNLAGKGAAEACNQIPGMPAAALPYCEKLGAKAFELAVNWVRGRAYRRPLYRIGMARVVRSVSELRPGEYHMPRKVIGTYQSKIRVGPFRFENGAAFDRARPRDESLAIKSELRAIDHTTATGEVPEVERTLYLPSSKCLAVPVQMGPTWMRDLDGELRKTLTPPPGLTGFDVSPIKRTDRGLASFPGWVDLEQ